MKPGALFLHIDNAGGGFHQLIEEVAKEYGLKREISRNYEHFEDATFNVRRFHYVACYETDISFHLWRKTHSKKVNNTLERKSPQVTINILPSSIQEQKYKYEEKAEIDSYNEINTPPLDQVNKRSSVNEHNNPSGCSKTVIPAYDQINTSQLDQVNSQSSLNQYNNPSGYSKTVAQKPLHEINRTNNTVIYEKKAVQSGIFQESLYVLYDNTRTEETFSRSVVPQRNSPSSSQSFSVMNYIRNAMYRELATLMIEELKKCFEDIVVINTSPSENFLKYLLETF
ncbi:hypothetical protein TNIN_15331 [Trichonephila inaurata madagascariensis]|uniref:Uncharacterized protein n=1 Tax=Trichonephila inaurata madagascariensis TaxID=2747483 RepID=A0A8X6I6X7_9ARAC|nr:hypothetical protein TNIN_15331 [Trichonephila inaurata madagascariensis]